MCIDEAIEVVGSKKGQYLFYLTFCEESGLLSGNATFTYDSTLANRVLLSRKLLRQLHGTANQQAVSRFVGWVSLIFGKLHSTGTKITFLPPIHNPITDYSTILECIYQAQKLSRASNMKYTHITVDAGTAAKFYHVIWNNSVVFHNVLIHLGTSTLWWNSFALSVKLLQGAVSKK